MRRKIHRSVLLPYSVTKVFALVQDIDRYSEFLPGCKASEVIERDLSAYKARLTVSVLGITEDVVTINKPVLDSEITLKLASGPFSEFAGKWQFHDLGEGCRVELLLDFAFESRLLSLVSTSLLERAVNAVLNAFASRARTLFDS